MSERPGHLTELARGIAGPDRLIVVVGEDGTLNEVVNGPAGTDVELAVLPTGTGQDFGRTHGIPTSSTRRSGRPRRDSPRDRRRSRGVPDAPGGENTRIFANVGSVGMSGAVARRANSMSKALGGRTTFYYALAREFVAWKNTEVTVALDDEQRRGRMHDVIVANGRWHGGGMKLAPDAQPDDGLFDVVLIGDVTKLDFLTTSPKLYRGGHVKHPRIDVLRSASLGVKSDAALPVELDGEVAGSTPVRFEIVREGLRLRSPANRPAGPGGLARRRPLLGSGRALARARRRRLPALGLDRGEALLDRGEPILDRIEPAQDPVTPVLELHRTLNRRSRRPALRDLPERALADRLELRDHGVLDHLGPFRRRFSRAKANRWPTLTLLTTVSDGIESGHGVSGQDKTLGCREPRAARPDPARARADLGGRLANLAAVPGRGVPARRER